MNNYNPNPIDTSSIELSDDLKMLVEELARNVHDIWALGRFNDSKRRTISIEVGMQNAGLATVLAGKHFPAMPEAAIASAVSCVWHSISGALLAGIFNFLQRKTASGR